MKQRSVRWMMCMIMFTVATVKAQNYTSQIKYKVIPLTIEISSAFTSNLIFPYPIKSVDRGSKDVLAQKAKGLENILQVKSAVDSIKETNLTVVCADGSLYSFLVRYNRTPNLLNLNLIPGIEQPSAALFAPNYNNEGKIYDLAEVLMLKAPILKKPTDFNFDIRLSCTGIYIKDDIFYYQLELANQSSVNYNIDQLRFSILDKKRVTRTATQELEIIPIQVTGNNKVIGAGARQYVIIAIEKFTIPDQKFLSIQLSEKGGGRHLQIRLNNNELINARQM